MFKALLLFCIVFIASVLPAQSLYAPQDFSVQMDKFGRAHLSWLHSQMPDPSMIGYLLWRNAEVRHFIPLNQSLNTVHMDAGLLPDKDYCYQIQSFGFVLGQNNIPVSSSLSPKHCVQSTYINSKPLKFRAQLFGPDYVLIQYDVLIEQKSLEPQRRPFWGQLYSNGRPSQQLIYAKADTAYNSPNLLQSQSFVILKRSDIVGYSNSGPSFFELYNKNQLCFQSKLLQTGRFLWHSFETTHAYSQESCLDFTRLISPKPVPKPHQVQTHYDQSTQTVRLSWQNHAPNEDAPSHTLRYLIQYKDCGIYNACQDLSEDSNLGLRYDFISDNTQLELDFMREQDHLRNLCFRVQSFDEDGRVSAYSDTACVNR